MSLVITQIKDLAHLKAELDKLPETAGGFQRLYRGQNQHYDGMIPSKFRGRDPYNTEDVSWKLVGQVIVKDEMLGIKPDGMPEENSAALNLAIEGLIQHYGLRSGGLDVTDDMMVALWFAQFKRFETDTTDTLLPGKNNTPGSFHFIKASYQLYDADFSYLYVFDCPLWQGNGHPVNGHCVNLQEPFKSFACRPTRQKGWYIYADNRKADKGNLQEFITAVFKIPGNLRQQLSEDRQEDVLYYFPQPGEDKIYEKLLKNFFIETKANNFERILKLPQYYSTVAEINGTDNAATYTGLILFTRYAGFFKSLRSFPAMGKHQMQLGTEAYFMTDAELIKMRIADWRLNQVATYTPGHTYFPVIEDIEFPAEHTRFNYFIELSIYELAGQTDPRTRSLRGVWIVQQEELIGIQLFFYGYDHINNGNTFFYKKLPDNSVELLIGGKAGDESLRRLYINTFENAFRVIQNERGLVYFKKYKPLKEFYGE